MAGDWIKMQTGLYRDPKVCAIADALMNPHGELASYVTQNCQREMTVTRNVMRNVTVGALVSVWGVMRLRGKRVNDDLVLKGSTLWIVDDLSELPGFGQAMESVGWIKADADGLVFPNFFCEHNVDPNEYANAKNAERQRRYREKHKTDSNVTSDVTVTSQSNTREEKRREDKPLTPQVGFERFWTAYPKKLSKGQAEKAWQKLSPDEQLLERIVSAVERAKTRADWRKDSGQFIPHPATWLNAKGWEDSAVIELPEQIRRVAV